MTPEDAMTDTKKCMGLYI